MNGKVMRMNGISDAIEKSAYHFDPNRMDPRFDTVMGLGHFEGDWSEDLKSAMDDSKPVTLATRSHYTSGDSGTEIKFSEYNPKDPRHKEPHYYSEKRFFGSKGVDYDNYKIINKTSTLGPMLLKICNAFKFAEPWSYTCHVQRTGEVFPWHIDVFHYRGIFQNHPQPHKLMRVMVMLTDWEPGHFIGYGNYSYTQWKAGDFHTLSHANVPHYTANASYNPRCMLLITGMKTDATDEFLWKAQNSKSIKVDEL